MTEFPLVGLTGGIGSGKSAALACFERLGCATLSSDLVVHAAYDFDVVRDAVVERWGDQVAPAGVVDRSEIARAAFASEQERDWLEQLLWPIVASEIDGWLNGLVELPLTPRAAVVEVPLLFEADMQDLFDLTVAVVVDDQLRDQRARARGHAALSDRHERQLTQEQKAERADHVLENHGSLEDLERQTEALLDRIAPLGG